MPEVLKGKIALITGGSKGIGLATAKLFVKQGAQVIVTGRNSKTLTVAKQELGKNTLYFQSDISNLSDLDQLFLKINEQFGKIDILFANAGVAERIWIGDVTEDAFDRIVNINYKGTYFTVQKSIPYLNKSASIILNASIAAIFALDYHTIYSSSKAAVIQLAKTLAADLAPQSIRVNSISPGYIKTPIWDQWLTDNPEKYKALCNTVPFEQRFGSAEELAEVLLFLASNASSYITAQNIVVDGGLTTLVPEYTLPC